MFNKIKSISRRTLAFVLTILMLLSSGIVGTLAANVDFAETGAYTDLVETGASFSKGKTFYLTPTSDWANTGAWFAVKFWYGTGQSTWVKMTVLDDDDTTYSAVAPSVSNTYYGMQFCRMNSAATTLEDNSVWNYTDTHQDNAQNYNHFTITGWSNGLGVGTWSNYTPTVYEKDEESGWYLKGTFDNWGTGVQFKYAETNYTGHLIKAELTVDAGTYYFKINNNSDWRGQASDGDITDTCTNYQTGTGDNIKFIASGGTYLFSYNTEDWKLTVSKAKPKYTVTINNNVLPASSKIYINSSEQDIDNAKNISFSVTEGDTIKVVVASPTYWYISKYDVTAGSTPTSYLGQSSYYTNQWYSTKYETTVNNNITIDLEHTHNPDVITGTVTDGGEIAFSGSGYNSYDTSVSYKGQVICTATPAEGYYVKSITATGATINQTITNTAKTDGAQTLTINSLTEDITFSAEFAKKASTLTVKETGKPEGAVVKLDDETTNSAEIEAGQTATIEITVPEKYTATVVGAGLNETLTAGTHELTTDEINDTTTINVTYSIVKNKVTVNVQPNNTFGTAVSNKTEVQIDDSVELTATPASDVYNFERWSISGTYSNTDVDLTNPTIIIYPTSDITATAIFSKGDVWTISVSADNGGTATASVTEIPQNSGLEVEINAEAPTGYKFDKWEVESGTCNYASGSDITASATIIPTSNVTLVAKFVPVSATVTFQSNNTEYGTVDITGGTATYTNPLTATATELGTNIFAGWTITGGAEGTDYEAVKVGKTITIKPLKDGKTLTVTANFIDALKAKVYTYSENGFTNLTLKEYNNTTPNPIYSGAQSEIIFDDDTWYTAGQDHNFIPTNNTKVTAQLDSGATSGGTTSGTTIYIELSDEWLNFNNYTANDKIYLTKTAQSNSAYADAMNASGVTDTAATSYNPKNDTLIGSGTHVSGNVYKFTLDANQISSTYGYSLFSKSAYANESKLWEVCFAHFHYNSGDDYYQVGSSYNHYNGNNHRVAAFTVTNKGEFPTSTSEIDVTNAFYSQSGGEWLGHEEVWLYFPDTNSYVATYRRALANTIASYTTLYNSDNAYGYTDDSWTDFKNAYKMAKAALGAGGSYTYGGTTYTISSQQDIEDVITALNTAYTSLEKLEYITVYTTNGTQATEYKKIGVTSLVIGTYVTKDSDLTYTLGTGKDVPIVKYSVKRDQSVTIQCVVQSDFSDYMVAGFVINGNEYEPAELLAGTTDTYIAQHSFAQGGDVIPVYFRKDVVDNNEKAVKVYFKYEPDKFEKWGNYVAAYTWTSSSTGNYDNDNFRQMGLWPGQVMIPVEGKTGVYYTWVEKEPTYTDEDGDSVTETVKGITFDNYGSNTYINTIERVQCYDYYEFVKLAESDLKYDNITFEIKLSNNINTDSTTHTYVENEFVDYVNQNGEPMDIFRTTENLSDEVGLYIVRRGPKLSTTSAATDTTLDGSYYVDCLVYDAKTGNYLGKCKSHMLVDITAWELTDVDWNYYAGKRVKVDYEGMTGSQVDGDNAYRFDGEWYGYHNISTATITVKSTIRNSATELTINTANLTNECDGGIATINGEASATLQLNATEKTLRAEANDHYRFVGWYIENEDQTIDLTKQASYMANYDIPLDFSTTYVAVFEEIPEGTLTVQNFYYTTSTSELKTGEVYADTHLLPPVMGGEDKYSNRTVTLQVCDSDGNPTGDPIVSTNYKADCVVEVGDKVQVSIITTPLYPGDTFYAFYERNNNNGVVNFEEVGTESQPSYAANQTATYTYYIDIEDEVDIRTYTVYSDVYHESTEVVLQYIYKNRFGNTLSYYTKHELSVDECNGFEGNGEKPMFPSTETLTKKSPYVDDLFKDVMWKVSQATKNNKHFTIVADEPDQYTVNLVVGSDSRQFTGAFNDSISVYATDINPEVTNRQGVWFVDKNGDADYDSDVDKLLAYGNYYGFVITDDMTICYDQTKNARDLGFKALLEEAVYGREQSTSADGTGLVDKVYVDYLISYLVPHFDKEILDGVTLNDKLNTDNTPVMLETLEQAGYTVDYGIVLEYLNTKGPDDEKTKETYETYYGQNKTELDKVTDLINDMAPDASQAEGKGSYNDADKLISYYYVWSHKSQTNEISNKNRLLMTFNFDNSAVNQAKYFNAVAYLRLTKDGVSECYFSNQGTLNIKGTGTIGQGVIVSPEDPTT